jgi:hypothetical protein
MDITSTIPCPPIRWLGAGLLLLAGCVEPYAPAVIDAPTAYLIVDGFLNGNGKTRIKLSRTTTLKATTAPPAERGAKLFVVDNTGTRHALTEQSSGYYLSDSLLLNPARQYQLRITTAANVAYASDLVPLKVTPPIDKLTWQLSGDDLRVALSTHDASGQARYYRWSFLETWEFNSVYSSYLQYNPLRKRIVGRATPVRTCWRTERPFTIKQASSAQLSQNMLTDVPMLTLSGHSERFMVRYSLLVNQYAETAEEFAYYELLRKNTEAIGTLNDPLPTQLTGNVHRLDATTEPVLGYVAAHTQQQQRLFINRQDLAVATGWQFDSFYQNCSTTPAREILADYKPILLPGQTYMFADPGSLPLEVILSGSGDTLGYTGAPAACVDCRLHGSLTRPSFW